MEKKYKAQSSTEFVAYLSITLFALTMLIGAISGQQQSVYNLEGAQQAQNTAQIMKENIHSALVAHEGYEREFSLPRYVNGKEYNVTITQGENTGYVAVDWDHPEDQITLRQTKYQPGMEEGDTLKFKSTEGTQFKITNIGSDISIDQK